MTPVRLDPAAPRSRVKHSTTEPLHSLLEVRADNRNFTVGLTGKHKFIVVVKQPKF